METEAKVDETKIDGAEAAAPAAPAAPVWPRVVTLKHPITYGSEQITQLTIRRGVAGDIRGIKLDNVIPASDLMLLASRLCGQNLKVIEMLDIDDAGEVMDVALDFFTKFVAGKKR